MEMSSGVRARRSRETSPDRARVYVQPKIKPFRKVQIIYYLCRNGQLEHPHFMEVTHLPNQQLRLKDVMDRLTVLRGRGMPSLYSWSCKRSYKNGYVWNDMSENDVIYPAEGAEYILKGSEIIEGCTDRFEQLQLGGSRRKPATIMTRNRHLHLEEDDEVEEEEDDDDEEEEEEIGEEAEDQRHHHHPNSGSSTNTPDNSRCSRGVSTDELNLTHHHQKTHIHHHHQHQQQQPQLIELPLDGASPPSSSSSEKANVPTATHVPTNPGSTNGGSKRLSDEADLDHPCQPRAPSVLLQLIACGSVAVKGRTGLLKPSSSVSAASSPVTHSGSVGNSGRKSGVSLHRGVLCRLAAVRAAGDEEEEEIRYMSENPRFGNPQMEDKEYFSGSIVEAIATETRAAAAEPALKKSSSYNEERSSKCGLGEVVEQMGEERSVKGKCMPSRNWKRSVFKK